jgi:hypothetical protein
MSEVHVIPDQRTTWRVYTAGAATPLSEHTNATEAEFAARARAAEHGAERVVVHDRYHRTHETHTAPPEGSPSGRAHASSPSFANALATSPAPARDDRTGVARSCVLGVGGREHSERRVAPDAVVRG